MKRILKALGGIFKERKQPDSENDNRQTLSVQTSSLSEPKPEPEPEPYVPHIDPAKGRKWLASHIQLPTQQEIDISKQHMKFAGNPRELVHKSKRFPIIMHEWLDSPEHDNAADSIDQAIGIFTAIEDTFTRAESHNFEARLTIIGNPAKKESDIQFSWSKFENQDGNGWRHSLNGHHAYFYDNGAILIVRRKKDINGTLELGPEFQKYGKSM